jgi:stearoyl-CoA desaturase (Delta-9 desaturase)
MEPMTDTRPSPAPMRRRPDDRINWVSSIPFLAFHLTPLLLLWTGISGRAVVLLLVTYWGRMFFITAGYHRYFAHRTYRMARAPQFLMAFGGTMALQKGPLWWAGHHRDHHRFSDTERDVHSPQKGFWWSHVGWILCDKYGPTETDRIKDFAKYPELRFLNRFDWIGPVVLGVACLVVGGWSGLVLGFFVSTVVLWHSTFFVNSLAHVMGRRRYATEDTSRNSALIAVLTMGEGWHNNHHHVPGSCRNGFFWWEWDPTYYLLKGLSWVGVVHDLRAPTATLLATGRLRDGSLDIGMVRASWNKVARTVAEANGVREHKDRLEALLDSSLESATELATSIRRGQRELLREG